MTRRTLIALVLSAALAAGGASALDAGESSAEQALARGVDDPALEWGGCPAFMPEGCRIAVLHGKPSERNADIFYQVPGGAEIPRHWHTSPERMVLVEGELEVTYDGQDPAVLAPGVYAYGPARKPHEAACLSDGPCTLYIGFVQPIDAMKGAPE